MDDTLVLEISGGEALYAVKSALFRISTEGKLDASVEAALADPDHEDAPRELLLAIRNSEFGGPGTTVVVRDEHHTWGELDDAPHAYVYSGFHHSHVDVRLDVTSQSKEQLVVALTVTTDDVVFYDERATASTIRGRLVLLPGELGDLCTP
jgi:hypothetical protein